MQRPQTELSDTQRQALGDAVAYLLERLAQHKAATQRSQKETGPNDGPAAKLETITQAGQKKQTSMPPAAGLDSTSSSGSRPN